MNIHKSIAVADVGLEHPIMYIEGACDSTETKPTDYIADGSIMTETNTGDVYIFNAKGGEWNKMFNMSGGGGSTSQNKVEKISGTLATFADDFKEYFGITSYNDAVFTELKFRRGDIHAVLMVDGTVLGAGENYFSFNPLFFDMGPYAPAADGEWFSCSFAYLSQNSGELNTGALLIFQPSSDFEALHAFMYQNGDGTSPIDIMPYAENIPYELTIYHHPMP